jgi:hypothetical protein
MKTLKLTIAAALLACTFQAASAQVSIGVRFGTPPPPRRVVVVREQPVYREEYDEPEYPVYRQENYYERPVFNEEYNEPRRVVYYNRGYRRPVVFHQNYYRRQGYFRRY